jgi:hypothetical protein
MSGKRLEQVAAAGGIAFVVLESMGQGLIQMGGAEPAFGAPADEIMAFFLARDETLFNWGGYLSLLSFIALLWFLGALWAAMRRAEGDPALLSMVAFGSGLVGVAALTGGTWAMAVFRIREGLDPQIGRTLYDLGKFAFATSWVFYASLLLAAGVAAILYRTLPRWLGWASIIVAIGLLVGRIIWTSQAAFVPWVLFWLWLIIVSVVLIRRAGKSQSEMATTG